MVIPQCTKKHKHIKKVKKKGLLTLTELLKACEWLLFNANSAICQPYHGENKLRWWWGSLCTRPTHRVGFL
jgi:hypothetical protein